MGAQSTIGEATMALEGRKMLVDSDARRWLTSHQKDSVQPANTICLTPRELGCTEHPLSREVCDNNRLLAWSREHLSEHRVIDIPYSRTFMWYLAKFPDEPAPILTAPGSVSIPGSRVPYILQAV